MTAALRDIEPISLAEVLAVAELQVRKDRKYLLPIDLVDAAVSGVQGEVRVLDIDGRRDFGYESLYFDTPDRLSYFDAAQRRPRRFKVRIRTYLDSDASMLEVKVRDARGSTVKHRQTHRVDARDRLTSDGRDFVASTGHVPVVDDLTPSLQTSYQRATLVCGDGDARATVDTDIRWNDPERSMTTSLEGVALIETKTTGRPCEVDRSLWRLGVRPTTVSKYCTGLAALHPELPANKWHRVLWDHLQRRGAPARMDDADIERVTDTITERVLVRLGPDLDERVVRLAVEEQFRRFQERATVRSYLEILTERAVCTALSLDADASEGAGRHS